MRGTCKSSGLKLKLPRISVDFHAYAWVGTAWLELELISNASHAYTCFQRLHPMRGWMMQGATLKDSGVGSAWMHACQCDFPRICVGLKLVGESGSRLSMSKRQLERELVGQGGFPRICVDFPRLCVVK
ncbi:hypothetical protein PIB30_076198 [Stylosanthes scabra]|uniref:Uncharacterized protein n=1 Tax=Stylosanthes scabra TaxID=79078 RepID=A0ABU6VNV6_9FABA|nr:hypothetical protein [Stylosanthes scabra]